VIPRICRSINLIVGAAWKLTPMGFTTAAVVAEQRGDIIQVTTGCKELDTILEGVHRWLCLHTCETEKLAAYDSLCSLSSQVVWRQDPSQRYMVRCKQPGLIKSMSLSMHKCCLVPTPVDFAGEFRCGKTQLCHTLCVTCQVSLAAG